MRLISLVSCQHTLTAAAAPREQAHTGHRVSPGSATRGARINLCPWTRNHRPRHRRHHGPALEVSMRHLPMIAKTPVRQTSTAVRSERSHPTGLGVCPKSDSFGFSQQSERLNPRAAAAAAASTRTKTVGRTSSVQKGHFPLQLSSS